MPGRSASAHSNDDPLDRRSPSIANLQGSPIAPATFCDSLAPRADSSRLSARPQRDAEIKPEIERIVEQNFSVSSVRKLWHLMCREGFRRGGRLPD